MTDDVNSNPNQPKEKPLESWKEIAVYLQRDVRTVRRWEKHEGRSMNFTNIETVSSGILAALK